MFVKYLSLLLIGAHLDKCCDKPEGFLHDWIRVDEEMTIDIMCSKHCIKGSVNLLALSDIIHICLRSQN